VNIINYKDVRQPWTLPPYPFYHTGPYLEEAMYEYYLKNRVSFDAIGFTYIPIFWTSAYMNGINVQPYVDALPKGNRYFAVSQHDDAIKEDMPPGTIEFEAGGNSVGDPIPLVCSPIPDVLYKDCHIPERTILASFVGSDTHPIRTEMINTYRTDKDFVIHDKPWSFDVSDRHREMFIKIGLLSKFTLCPRGYGAQSFRIYEAMQLGSIPVVIYDKEWFPFDDIVSWKQFAILIHKDDIPYIKNILLNVPDEERVRMQKMGAYMIRNFFNIDAVCKRIHTKLVDIYLHENH
jgi:hypothetical protein